jgi:phosphatidylglycerophosphate synthase
MAEPTSNSEAADRRPLKSRSYGWVRRLSSALVVAKISPNGISAFGVVLAMIAFAVLWTVSRGWIAGWIGFIIAVLCVQGRLMCNLLDGLVAVEGGRKSKGGDLFNEIPDRVEDTLFLAGAGLACGHIALGLLASVLAVFTAYVRAFGASLGHGQDFSGPCAKPQRMFLLTLGLLAAAVFYFLRVPVNALWWTLWLITAGTALTAALRIRRLYAKSP